MKRVGQLVGVEERFLVRAMRGKSFSRNLSWNQFHEIFRENDFITRLFAARVRVVVSDPDYYLKIFDLFCDIILGTINLQVGSNARNLSIHHRFYVALALNDLVNEVPLSKVAKKYDASKGMLQGLQQTVSSFAGMVSMMV